MASATAESKAKVQLTDGWYHFGMLPAQGEIEWLMPAPNGERDGMNRTVFTRTMKSTAWNSWNTPHDSEVPYIWVSKCRPFNQLSIGPVSFPGYSEYTDRRGTGQSEQLIQNPYPGQVSYFMRALAESCVQACFRHFVRFSQGTESMQSPSPNRVEIHDLDKGARPSGWKDDASWNVAVGEGRIPSPETFDSSTDKYVAEFVYFVRLDVPAWPQGWERKSYMENPNKHHVRLAPNMDENFFKSPPRSVMEQYGPQFI